jgi:site-specific recombinase XerD
MELDHYLDSCRNKYTNQSWKYAKIYCSEAMLLFSDFSRTKIEEITYQDIITLYNADLSCTDKTKSIIINHAARMLSFYTKKGLCKRGYSMLLDNSIYPYVGFFAKFSQEHQASIRELRTKSLDFPADEFYDSIDSFISTLQNHSYTGTTLYLARKALTALYLFLDIHNLGYLPEIVWVWFAEVQNAMGKSWKHWRRILKCYEEYADNGDIIPEKRYRYEPSSLETLPGWCREAISGFQNQILRKFRSAETADTAQYPCIRFCKYLINCGISAFDGITPDIINEFSRTDQHKTFTGRSSYFTVVRQFLEYLETKGFINNKSLHYCLSTGTAPVEKIVDVLTDDQIARINDYRQSRSRPIELRNIAIIMAGIRMGLRASDVVNLKFSDINWKKRQVTIIQQKTQAQLTLSIPVDAGNSIYKYIRDGRPKSNVSYIFIRHKAPYSKLTIKNCTKALHSILPERKAVSGGGFHVTRRTFATRLLRNNASIETVMDSLGHQDNTSVMSYLSMDEKRIQSCALSLAETNLALKKGGLRDYDGML